MFFEYVIELNQSEEFGQIENGTNVWVNDSKLNS